MHVAILIGNILFLTYLRLVTVQEDCANVHCVVQCGAIDGLCKNCFKAQHVHSIKIELSCGHSVSLRAKKTVFVLFFRHLHEVAIKSVFSSDVINYESLAETSQIGPRPLKI